MLALQFTREDLLANWDNESNRQKLARLREELKQAQEELAEAEANRAEQLADITAIEKKLERRIGHLIAQLATLDSDIETYRQQLQRIRSQGVLGSQYLPVEEQYRRTWEVPQKTGEDIPLGSIDEKQIKRLYRRLARRYHPDLAKDSDEIDYRTQKMAALNEAYKARSLIEIFALASEPKTGAIGLDGHRDTEAHMVKALEEELARIRNQMRQIEIEIENSHNSEIVQLSLEVKFAQRGGRDLLAEMAIDLRKTIRRRRSERDQLKAQLNQL